MKNGLKAEDEEIYKNEEIKLLLYALGIDINSYNPNKLRYGKVAICVDPDSDGFHIALLIMANLHRLCPQFLQENRLFWLAHHSLSNKTRMVIQLVGIILMKNLIKFVVN